MTSKTPWTPGPWEIASDEVRGYFTIVSRGQYGSHICALPCNPWSSRNEANARLIAEAPAMEELLRDAMPIFKARALEGAEDQERYRRARAILARIGAT